MLVREELRASTTFCTSSERYSFRALYKRGGGGIDGRNKELGEVGGGIGMEGTGEGGGRGTGR